MATQRVILVTGTSSGFGYLTATTLARHGHTVFAAMRDIEGRNAENAEKLVRASEQAGSSLTIVAMDTSDQSSVDHGVQQVIARAGHVDVLVNNVGRGSWGLTEGFTVEQMQAQLESNFLSAVRTNRAAVPYMRQRGEGLLVQVSSLIGRLVLPFMTAYSAAKHAAEALAEGYRYELAPFGIDSVIVEPQSYPTDGSLHKMLIPADRERVIAYGALAQRADAMFAANDQTLSAADAPKPEDVAQAIAALIVMPVGQRPLRTVVGGPMTQLVHPINQATEQAQAQLLQFTGLADLLTVTTKQ